MPDDTTIAAPDATAPSDDTSQGMLAAMDTALGAAPEPVEEAPPAAEPPAESVAALPQGEVSAPPPGGEAATPPAEPATPPPEAPPQDPYAMPDGLTPKAQARFRELTDTLRTTSQRAQTAEQAMTQFRGVLDQAGTTPQQLGAMLEFGRLMNEGGPENLRAALSVLDQQRAFIAQALGEELPGVDLLAGYPDLQTAVEQLDITPEMARRIAAERAQAQRQQAQVQAQLQGLETARTRSQAQAQVQQVSQQIDAVGAQWAAQDPDFQAKWSVISANLDTLRDAEGRVQLPPGQWLPWLQRQYEVVSRAWPARPAAPRQPGPLTASSLAGGGAPAPKSALEAMELALSQSRS